MFTKFMILPHSKNGIVCCIDYLGMYVVTLLVKIGTYVVILLQKVLWGVLI